MDLAELLLLGLRKSGGSAERDTAETIARRQILVMVSSPQRRHAPRASSLPGELSRPLEAHPF